MPAAIYGADVHHWDFWVCGSKAIMRLCWWNKEKPSIVCRDDTEWTQAAASTISEEAGRAQCGWNFKRVRVDVVVGYCMPWCSWKFSHSLILSFQRTRQSFGRHQRKCSIGIHQRCTCKRICNWWDSQRLWLWSTCQVWIHCKFKWTKNTRLIPLYERNQSSCKILFVL